MKRQIAILSLIVSLISLGAYSTVAAFTATGTAKNFITTGKIDIEVIETMLDGDGGEVEYAEPERGIMPADLISKIVRVKNISTHPAYIRAKIDWEFETAGLEKKYVTLNEPEDSKWIYNDDGYYYYTEILEPDESTEPLIKSVSVASEMDNDYMDQRLKVDVTAYAVQSEYNGESYTDAQGWPAEINGE